MPVRTYRLSTGKAEDVECYVPGGFHPILLGDILKDGRYRIVHKLGFGSFSTVWLARDNFDVKFVCLKISKADAPQSSDEIKILRYLAAQGKQHPGSEFVMNMSDEFIIEGPNGSHQCLVTQAAGRRFFQPANVTYKNLGPARLLLSQLFQGVDYLHSCSVGHGGNCFYLFLLGELG